MRGKRAVDRVCSMPECGREVESNGLCAMHARRARRNGDPSIVLKMSQKGLSCSVEGCNNPAHSKGYCQTHYDSTHKHGRTYLVLAPDGTGYVNRDGYREFCIDGRKVTEHVLRAEKALGKRLPPKAVVHHMNGNKLDNFTPFNLVVCPDQAYHLLLHKRARQLFNEIEGEL